MRKNTYWRNSCLSILDSGISGPEDWGLAAELIDLKMAHGTYARDYTNGGIAEIIWGGPTLEGRFKADDLAEDVRRETWQYRLMTVCTHLGTFLAGAVIAYLGALFNYWLVCVS